MFADLVGSTSLQERTDAESVRHLMEQYYAIVRAAIESHGGTVVKLMGDGVMAVFGVPNVAEDDALRAVRGAVAAQEAFTRMAGDVAGRMGALAMRVGVNTGEVVVSEGNDDVVGDPVNVAARLEQEAANGGVLIGETTRRLVHHKVTLAAAGELALKGRADPVAAFRVVSLQVPSAPAATVFVGREHELDRLTAVYADAVGSAHSRLAMVIGSPGLGKSRLIGEVAHEVSAQSIVLLGRCDHAGGATFAPFADALRSLTELDEGADADTAREAIARLVGEREPEGDRIISGVTSLLGGAAPSTEEAFWAVRRFLRVLALRRPVLLVLDDLHWAEPLLLDLIEHIVEWSDDVPLFLLGAARSELRDTRAALTVPGTTVSDIVTLGGLDARAATRLAADVLGADELPAAVAGHVLAASAGNPLFLRELVRMLVDDGAVVRSGDRWTATVELAEREIPPTIQALLAARLERLRPDERTVLERAAVVGDQFSRAAVEHLLPTTVRTDLDAHLEALRRRELVERDTGWFLGEPVYRFHHVLIHDAAYRRLLKGARADLHVEFADWLQASAGDALAEHDETLGWHLEQAHQHLRELGPLDERGRACGVRAAHHLATAGRAAFGRDDVAAAAGLFGRALAGIERADDERTELMLDWCEALLAVGDVKNAARAVDELREAIGDSRRLHAWHACLAGQLAVLTAPQRLRETADDVAQAAVTLAADNDDAGAATAHWVHALALSRLGEVGATEAALDRALAAARRAGDRRRANAVLAEAPLAALAGPSPVTRASGRCLDVVRVLRITAGAPAVEAVALRCQAVLEALRDRVDAARRMIDASRRIVEDLGVAPRILETDMFAGMIELLAGEPVAAERLLRTAYDGFRSRGLRVSAAQSAALLAHAVLDQGRPADAEALSIASEELAGDDLKAGIAWRGVRAEALVQRGEHDGAVQYARDAVALAAPTDALLDHADARMALAIALHAAGRVDDARIETDRATELWDTKGATLLAERARGAHAPVAEREVDRDTTAEIAAYFENVAASTMSRTVEALNREDWAVFVSFLAPHYVQHDRRRFGAGAEIDLEDYLATNRDAMAFGTSWTISLLATREQHLSLHRARWSAARKATAASELDFLTLDEVDASGQRVFSALFDADDVDAAFAELDARVLDGEALAYAQTVSEHDWCALRALLADDHVLVDHRPIGWGTLHGPDAYVEMFRTFGELTRDLRLVMYHRAHRGGAVLSVGATKGQGDGGPFENPLVSVSEYDKAGRIRRREMYPLDQFANARKRFESFSGEVRDSTVETHGFENLVTANIRRFVASFDARDWSGVADTIASDGRYDDRRDLLGTTILEATRLLFDVPSLFWDYDVVATRGEYLALSKIRLHGASDETTFADEHYSLLEVDEQGRVARSMLFAADDIDGAYDALDTRYLARADPGTARSIAAARAHTQAVAMQDLDALAPMHADDFVAEDHRPVGWGTYNGVAAYLDLIRSLGTMSRRLRVRVYHSVSKGRMMLEVVTLFGDGDAGPFEIPTVALWERDEDTRLRRWDVYGIDQLAEARQRFESATA